MSLQSSDRPNFIEISDRVRQLANEILCSENGNLSLLNEFDDFVYLKRANGIVSWSNQAYERFYCNDESASGRHGQTFLDPTVLQIAKHTDALILNGSSHLDCEHVGCNGNGERYLLRTYKVGLHHTSNSKYAILGVTRAVRQLNSNDSDPDLEMANLASLFGSFSDRDRELCRLLALGFSSGDIGEQMKMTSRNVDLRRKKCLDLLGIDKVVDLARLLTRLDERGYIEIDL
jgi:DNA-binding CsgD family transcriptional regulator